MKREGSTDNESVGKEKENKNRDDRDVKVKGGDDGVDKTIGKDD